MVMRRRITKKQLKQDKFVQKAFEFTGWARQNQRTVILTALGIILVVVVGYAFTSYKKKKDVSAYSSFSQSMQAYRSGNFALAAADLEKILSEHGGAGIQDEVLYFLATAQARTGDFDKALATLARFQDEFGDGSKFSHDATLTLASVLEEKEDLEKAADTYVHAASIARFLYQEKSDRMNAARIYRQVGKGDKAQEQYTHLVEKLSGAEAPQAEIDEVRMLEAEVSAMAHGGDRME
jgi:tetratricopeptide (TPR) repeat protein